MRPLGPGRVPRLASRRRRGRLVLVAPVPASTAGQSSLAAAVGAPPMPHVPRARGARQARDRQVGAAAADPAYRASGSRASPTVVLISTMHGNERATAADPPVAARRRADPRRRPVGGADLQPRRPRARAPARTRAASTSTATSRTSWADLDGNYESGPRPASEPETRAMMRFLRDDPAGLDPQLPPAAARRRHRHQAPGVRAPGRPQARPAPQDVRLRRRLPRHHDRLVQPPVHGLGAHRRVRRHAADAADAGEAPRQVLSVFGARRR